MRIPLLKRILSRFDAIRETHHIDVHLQYRLLEENEQLKVDLKKISTILNILPFPIWARNKELHITYRNLAYVELLEQEDEHVESHAESLFAQNAKKTAEKAQESSLAQSFNHQICNDGYVKKMQISEVPVRDEDILIGFGCYTGATIMSMDDAGHYVSATAIYGPDMVLQYCNDAFCHLWGLNKHFLEGKPDYGQVLNQLREERKIPEQANFSAFKKGRLNLFSELTAPFNDCLYLPDGRSIQMEVQRHNAGGLIFSYEDITQRLSFERSFNMLTAVQKTVLEHLHEGVVVFGQNGRLTYYNSTYARMWGLDASFLVTNPHVSELMEVLKPLCCVDDWATFKASLVAIIAERIASRESIAMADGRTIERICVPLPDGGMMISYLNVTDLSVKKQKVRLKSV